MRRSGGRTRVAAARPPRHRHRRRSWEDAEVVRRRAARRCRAWAAVEVRHRTRSSPRHRVDSPWWCCCRCNEYYSTYVLIRLLYGVERAESERASERANERVNGVSIRGAAT